MPGDQLDHPQHHRESFRDRRPQDKVRLFPVPILSQQQSKKLRELLGDETVMRPDLVIWRERGKSGSVEICKLESKSNGKEGVYEIPCAHLSKK